MYSVLDLRIPTGGVSESEDPAHSLASGLGEMTSDDCRDLPFRSLGIVLALSGGDSSAGVDGRGMKAGLGGGMGAAMPSVKKLVLVAGAETGRGLAVSSASALALSRRLRSREALRIFSIPSSICSASMMGLEVSDRRGGEGLREGGECERLKRETRACFDMYL